MGIYFIALKTNTARASASKIYQAKYHAYLDLTFLKGKNDLIVPILGRRHDSSFA